jgi:O-antigen/teichoic acid export membrane protein
MATEKIPVSLKEQGAWLLFAKIIGFAISFVLPLLIVRHLTQEKFGVYRQSFQFIINAVAILPVGFSMSAFYYLNREEKNKKSAIFNILLFNFVVGGLACAGLYFYPQFLGNIYQSEEMTQLAPKIGAVIWLWIFSAFLELVATSNQEARLATFFIIFAQFSKTVLMAGAVIIFGTIESFIYAAMIQAALQTVILFLYLNYRFPKFWLEFNWKFFREQALYALPFGLAGVMWTLQSDIHTYFVGHRFSDAEYAIYSVGCFQLPLLTMLAESTGAVLISRMSELQSQNDNRQIITLTARAMQKLSFFYFPAYAFMLVTAYTLITTLYTERFAASVSIFIINLTLLPFDIWIIDPILRAYKKFGRVLLILRVFILTGLIMALWFGIQHFDLRGMIAIVIVTSLLERFILSAILLGKLDLRWSDWGLLKSVVKTAIVSAIAGIITFFVYRQIREITPSIINSIMQIIFSTPKESIVHFIAGTTTLGISFAVFAPVYLFGMNYLNIIDEDEKLFIKGVFTKITNVFKRNTEAHSEN